MAGALGNLLIMLTADTAQARDDIGKAAHQVERDMANMQRNATAAGVAIAATITAIGYAFAKSAQDTIKFGDELSKMSQRTSFSVERLSEMAFAADLADVSMGQMNTALGMFNKVLADASREGSKASALFKSLGVDVSQGPQVAFEQFARSLNALPNGEQKVAAMRAAFGRSGEALIPLITGLGEATEKARSLGLVMSKQAAEDSEKFNDALTTLKTTISRLNVSLVGEALPGLTSFINEMIEGKRIAGGFADALVTLGTINPFRSVSGNIKEISAEIEDLQKARERYVKSNADTSAIDQAIVRSKKQLEFLKYQQQQQALALGGADTAGERARMGLTGGRTWAGVEDGGGKGGKAKRDDNLAGRQWQEWMDEEAKIMAEAAAATDKYNQTIRANEEATVKAEIAAQVARAESIVQMDEIIARQTLMANGFDETGKAIADNAKKTSDWGREMGLTFSSAFEDAIIKGNKFSDVVRGIGQDLLRIAARKLVTEPMGKMFSGWLESGIGAIFGGGKAAGGPVSPGTTYLVGEKGPELLTMGSGAGMITPNNAMGGGATYNIDARGADRSGMDNLLAYIRSVDGSIEQRSVAAVSDTRRRGGSLARSMG